MTLNTESENGNQGAATPNNPVTGGTIDGAIAESVALRFPSAVADLSDLVRIPSVSWSAFDPAHVATSASAVAELLSATGVFDSVAVKTAAGPDGNQGHPAVLARRAAKNGKPTVLLYAHHDVQPPGANEDWDTPPYEPTIVGDRLFGRGASDDKAGVISHLAAIRAVHDVLGDDLDVGLSLFIEGEEEFGSSSFAQFLVDNRDDLAADVIVVADSDNWDIDTPALTTSLRGAVAFNLRIRTLKHASHSGMYGGAAPDAMLAAVKLLGTFHHNNGSVAVEGLTTYAAETPEFSEDELRADAGFIDGLASVGTGSVLSRLWFQPAITFTGIDAPTIANASNTLVPVVTVRVSARIAPGQDPETAMRAFQNHINKHVPFGASVEILDTDLGSPFLADTSGWATTEIRAAMADAWGRPAVDTGIGGSIPFVADLAREFPAAQILVTGVEDPATKAHSPNESQHLGVLKRAILTEALFLARLNDRLA